MVFLIGMVLAAGAACPRADAADADPLVELIKQSDVVVLGQVVRITEGELDPDLLQMGQKFRTDVATIAVIEVLKGDPKLERKTVRLGFPGIPKPGGVTLKLNQNGVWLLVKSDRKFYELKTASRFLAADKLGAARRAARTAVGIVEPRETPEKRSERIKRLLGVLADKDKPDAARRLAAYQLGQMGELSAVPRLVNALADAAPSVRLTADLALQKITGHRSQVDFRNGAPAVRAEGIDAWREWWDANKDKDHKAILLAAARKSHQPQPNFQYAVEGLARYDDPALLPVFRAALDTAIARKNSDLTVAAARYLGRTKHRASVPRLAGVLGEDWATPSAQAAAAAAVGRIVGRDFGTGTKAIGRCAKWWSENKTTNRP